MIRDKSMGRLKPAELPFTSLQRIENRIKRRQQSLDMQETRRALLEDHRYEKCNVYLSVTPFHSAASSMLAGKTQDSLKNDVQDFAQPKYYRERNIENDLRQSASKEAEEDEIQRLLKTKGKIPPKALVDVDKEIVENLDAWSIKKNAYITIMPTKKDPENEEGGDSTFKTQPRPLGFTKRNTISLDVLKKIQSSKARPSLKLAPDQKLSIALSPVIARPFPSVTSIPEGISDNDDSESNVSFRKPPPLPQIMGYINDDNNEENTMSPRRTSIGDLLMTNATSKNVEYENKIYQKYQRYLQKLEKKKKKDMRLTAEKSNTLKEIAALRETIKDLQTAGKRSAHHATVPTQNEDSAKYPKALASPLGNKFVEAGVHMVREKRVMLIRSYDEQIVKLRTTVDSLNKQIDKLTQKIQYLKITVAQLRQELCDHYHKLLSVGNDTRQEGMVWIIKAIWNLGNNVNISKLPAYLEEKSVEYLFAVARKEFELEQLRGELKNCLKREESKDQVGNSEAKELEKEILAIKKTLKEMRDKENRRITREFKLNGYALKYNVTLQNVLVALFGVEYAKQEMERVDLKQVMLIILTYMVLQCTHIYFLLIIQFGNQLFLYTFQDLNYILQLLPLKKNFRSFHRFGCTAIFFIKLFPNLFF
eukprot:TRINITY_DN1447_c0_g1_i1.p1 TRINITY_DN1447_c0_g1~~TRINITY_DN1447_c0_g1_i1.p1  ORF type:complete len:649 (-),score=51.36 TRINITY_DN1447_c0_g1_i1:1171-3117(-)